MAKRKRKRKMKRKRKKKKKKKKKKKELYITTPDQPPHGGVTGIINSSTAVKGHP